MSIVTYVECDGCGQAHRGEQYPDSWSLFLPDGMTTEYQHFCSAECAADAIAGENHPSQADLMIKRLGITTIEITLIEQLAHGLSNKEIAIQKDLAESTIKNRLSDIYAKLGVLDRIQAVLISGALGIIDLNSISAQSRAAQRLKLQDRQL